MDDAKFERLIKETHQLAQENHALLKKLNRARVWGTIFEIAKWTIIIGVSVGSYYVIQPFLSLDFFERLRALLGK